MIRNPEQFIYQAAFLSILLAALVAIAVSMYRNITESLKAWWSREPLSETAQTFQKSCARLEEMPTEKLLEERRYLMMRYEKSAEARDEKAMSIYMQEIDKINRVLSGNVTKEEYDVASTAKLKRELKADLVDDVTRKLQHHFAQIEAQKNARAAMDM